MNHTIFINSEHACEFVIAKKQLRFSEGQAVSVSSPTLEFTQYKINF